MEKKLAWINSVSAPIWVDLIRIPVGFFLVYKGIIFATHFESFMANIQSVGWVFVGAHVAQLIIFIHAVCGSLLALGAATKWMSLLNLPILMGAILFNYKKLLMVENYMELNTTIILTVLLLLLFFMGSGKISLDQMRKTDVG